MEKSVNELLHRARGEQFRHDQNIQKKKVRHRSRLPTRSLPPHLLASSDSGEQVPSSVPSGRVSNTAGPVPKSWRLVTNDIQDKTSPEWRADALSLVLSGFQVNHMAVPSLVELCMRVLLDAFSELEDFEQLLLPLLPLHLRYALQRYTAIYAPLSTPWLNALVGRSGHINGEFIAVGPSASASLHREEIASKPSIPVDWEAEDQFLDSFELRTLALVSTELSIQTLFSFPRSLTRLALVDISHQPLISKLPRLCPSLVILDLSFNSWLKDPDESHEILGVINWNKWYGLDILGLRGCSVRRDTLVKVNQNRLADVHIFLE